MSAQIFLAGTIEKWISPDFSLRATFEKGFSLNDAARTKVKTAAASEGAVLKPPG